MPSAQTALEALTQDPDLARLERLLQRFNLFEAIGVLRQELRHSDLLATLLDPRQSHGLGTLFLTELLHVAAPTLDTSNLGHARVEREWHNVDILVVDDTCRLAVIIENKIDTGEIPGQLSRYYADVRSHFPEHKIAAIYLTRNGGPPTDKRYHAVSYTQICHILEELVKNSRSRLSDDIVMLLENYTQMLRRHIMSDSGEAELCRAIYQKHKQALDSIFEHRLDQQASINDYTHQLIRDEPRIKLCFSKKDYVQFNPIAWDNPLTGEPFNPDCPWLLYFQFVNNPKSLLIVLIMTPGELPRRERLFEVAQQQQFMGCPDKLSTLRGRGGWIRLYEKTFLKEADYDKTQEDIEAIVSQKWDEFLVQDLQHITQSIRDEKWLWELPG